MAPSDLSYDSEDESDMYSEPAPQPKLRRSDSAPSASRDRRHDDKRSIGNSGGKGRRSSGSGSRPSSAGSTRQRPASSSGRLKSSGGRIKEGASMNSRGMRDSRSAAELRKGASGSGHKTSGQSGSQGSSCSGIIRGVSPRYDQHHQDRRFAQTADTYPSYVSEDSWMSSRSASKLSVAREPLHGHHNVFSGQGTIGSADHRETHAWNSRLAACEPAGKCSMMLNEKGIVKNKAAVHPETFGETQHKFQGKRITHSHPGRSDVAEKVITGSDQFAIVSKNPGVDMEHSYGDGHVGKPSYFDEEEDIRRKKDLAARAASLSRRTPRVKIEIDLGVAPRWKPSDYTSPMQLEQVGDVVFGYNLDRNMPTSPKEVTEVYKTACDGAAGMMSNFQPPTRQNRNYQAANPVFKHRTNSVSSTPMTETHMGREMPSLFLSHGTGAMPLLWPKDHPCVRSLAQMPAKNGLTPSNVRCIVVISAHWETEGGLEVTRIEGRQSLEYDYSGYPAECYSLRYTPLGCPQVADRCLELLNGMGVPAKANDRRRLDHGCYVPLMMFQGLEGVPVVQVSLPKVSKHPLDNARFALHIGKALSPLRSEGVLLIGSGQAVNPNKAHVCITDIEAFVKSLKRCIRSDPAERWRTIEHWNTELSNARKAHGREEHLMPLLVVAGSAAAEPGKVIGDFWEGSLAMLHFRFGAALSR